MGTGIYNPREQQSLPVKSWNLIKQFRYDIGDRGPGGGIIVAKPTMSQRTSVFFYYIEIAPPGWYGTDDDPLATWGCFGTNLPGANGQLITDSLQNTIDIVTACPTPGIAADLARSYTGGGKTDWCLPALYGLTTCYKIGINLDIPNQGNNAFQRLGLRMTAGAGNVNGQYWSSTENNANVAHTYSPSTTSGDFSSSGKNDSNYVRPIRVFTSESV
jgi:hypothetical protein